MSDVVTQRYEECRPIMDQALRYARATFAKHVGDDILEDQAIDAFLYASRAYDESRGMTFISFLRLCLKSRFLSLAERRSRMHSLGKSTAKSILALHLTDKMEPFVPECTHDDVGDLLERVRQAAGDEVRRLAQAIVVEGNSKASAARQLGLSKAQIEAYLEAIAEVVFGCSGTKLTELAKRLHVIS